MIGNVATRVYSICIDTIEYAVDSILAYIDIMKYANVAEK